MTTREYLQQIERYDYIIENKLREIERLEMLLKTIPALPYDKDRVMSSGDYDRIGVSVAQMLDDKANIEKLLDESKRKRSRIIRQIESLPNPKHIKVLSERYLKYQELFRLENVVGYSYNQVKNIHRDAIAEFEKLYKNEYKNFTSWSTIDPA